jgi:branched-chain amino acid transport system substrate-binding protein
MSFLIHFLSWLVLIVAPVVANAQFSDDLIKIGVLTDLSGPAASSTGPGSVLAAQMAVEDFGGEVAGRSIEISLEGCLRKRNQ